MGVQAPMKELLASGSGGVARSGLWDLTTGKGTRATLRGHTRGVASVVYSPDGMTLCLRELGRDYQAVGRAQRNG